MIEYYRAGAGSCVGWAAAYVAAPEREEKTGKGKFSAAAYVAAPGMDEKKAEGRCERWNKGNRNWNIKKE